METQGLVDVFNGREIEKGHLVMENVIREPRSIIRGAA
jgi:hypothetical protein